MNSSLRQEPPPLDQRYQIVSTADSNLSLDSRPVAEFLAKDGQLLFPMLDLVEQAQLAIDDLIDVMGRATIEAVLQRSAAQLAGPKQQGQAAQREIVYHGTQKGRVALKERQLRVDKPRLRKRRRAEGESGEVEVPAYAALQKDARLAERRHGCEMDGRRLRRVGGELPPHHGARARVDAQSRAGRADARHATCAGDESGLTSFNPQSRHRYFPLAVGHHPS